MRHSVEESNTERENQECSRDAQLLHISEMEIQFKQSRVIQ